ncbi:MAG: hypothetical protein AB7R90_02100 [Reyranellaceae bacterium]
MRSLAIAAMALAVAFFAAAMAVRLVYYGHFSPSLMDDAFFFVRYGNNFLDTGVFAWNRGEGPVFGNTSQLYQLLVTVLLWLLERNAVLSVTLAAVLGALVYLAALPSAYWTSRPHAEPTLRLLVVAVLAGLVAFDGQLFLLIGAGMETSWAMALVALGLLLAFRVQNGEAGWRLLALNSACIAAVYATRPDATLLALAAPAGLALFSPVPVLRRAGLKICLLSLVLVAAVAGLCWLYYGDPLPLAFLAKTLPFTNLPTDDSGIALAEPSRHLYDTFIWHVPEFVLGLAALGFFFRLSPVMRGAALGMLAFFAYHHFAVLPVMGYFGRFLAPALPVLALLAAGTIEAILRRSGLARGLRAVGLAGALLLAGLALLMAHKVVPTAIRVAAYHVPGDDKDISLSTGEAAIAHAAREFAFFRPRMVELVRALGDDCSIASTEDGILSAYARFNRVVDYSGLHDRRIVREGFSAGRMLEEARPDVLVLPPRWYRQWGRAIESHPAFARDYLAEPAWSDTALPIAFRKDSVCAARVRQALYGR